MPTYVATRPFGKTIGPISAYNCYRAAEHFAGVLRHGISRFIRCGEWWFSDTGKRLFRIDKQSSPVVNKFDNWLRTWFPVHKTFITMFGSQSQPISHTSGANTLIYVDYRAYEPDYNILLLGELKTTKGMVVLHGNNFNANARLYTEFFDNTLKPLGWTKVSHSSSLSPGRREILWINPLARKTLSVLGSIAG